MYVCICRAVTEAEVRGCIAAGACTVEDVSDLCEAGTGCGSCTEWPEFRVLDWGRLAELVERRIVVDTRNLLDADVLRRVGFEVRGIGRRARSWSSSG